MKEAVRVLLRRVVRQTSRQRRLSEQAERELLEPNRQRRYSDRSSGKPADSERQSLKLAHEVYQLGLRHVILIQQSRSLPHSEFSLETRDTFYRRKSGGNYQITRRSTALPG
eukprot:sb/3477051/